MSDVSEPDFNIREQIARIDRTQAELKKLLSEASKLDSERLKLDVETGKLAAETRKFNREGLIQTLLAVTGLIGGIITVVQLILKVRGVT